MNRLRVGVTAVVIVALSGKSAFAKRLLTATVELDGKAVLETKFSDDGTRTPETVWRYLGEPPGWAEVSHIEASAENPLQADLAGELVIRIQHVDRPIVEAKASKLKLVRDDETSDHWYLPSDEVERTAKLNGIAEPSPLEMPRRNRVLWMVGGGGILFVVVIVILWLKPGGRPERSSDSDKQL